MEEMPGMPTGIRFPGGGTRRGQFREGDSGSGSGAAGARKPRPRLVEKLTTSPTYPCELPPLPPLDAVGVNHGNRDTRRTRTYATAHAATGDGE